MEGKAHSKHTYNVTGQVSRMEQDLLNCSENFQASFKLRTPTRMGSTLDGEKGARPHVCIVGAGLAGLRCAQVLIEQDVRVTIIEARDRLGGRVCQTNFAGDEVDMGPNWIHGTDSNPVLRLARDTNSVLSLAEDEPLVYNEHGSLTDPHKTADLFDLIWSIVSEAFKFSNERCSIIPSSTSLKDFFVEKLVQQELNVDKQTLVLQLAEMWGSYTGDPLEKQSLRYMWLEECLDGENLYVANNHKRILLRVAESALNGAEIHLCTKVVAIQDQPGPEQNPRVLVHTDGRSFDFDEVVLTVPLGCLKRNDIAFNPPVPSAIEQAINATSYSRLEKVYISFPAAFWDTASHQLSPLTNIPSDGSFVESREWASGDHKNSVPRFPGFAHFLCPTYSAQNPECWTLEVQSLSSSIHFGEYARPTLLFSIYGPCATHITSLITSLSPSSPQYFTAINDFFRPYYALLPNYVPEHPDCHPRMVLATDWHHDELAGCGSYMNFQVRKDIENGQDAVMLEDDIRALREGMPERGIWLAGEHTAPFVALGTTTGAYWSGESVGMRILGAYGLAKPGMTDSGVDSTI